MTGNDVSEDNMNVIKMGCRLRCTTMEKERTKNKTIDCICFWCFLVVGGVVELLFGGFLGIIIG